MELLKQIQKEIESGHPQETSELVREALKNEIAAEDIVNLAMLPAMRSAGAEMEEMGNLPQLLAAARSVRLGFDMIESETEGYCQNFTGTAILGTVEGDLHDVGKNLVALMLRSEGFKVLDLGVDISEKQFLKAIQENPDVEIVCVSSLLTTSLRDMTKVVKRLRSVPNRKFKIMVGGGAVSKELAMKIGADAFTENAVDAAVWARKYVTESGE